MFARTTATFEFESSFRAIGIFFSFNLGIILSVVIGGPLLMIIYLAVAGYMFSTYRANVRVSIKRKYGMPAGGYVDDLAIQCCCSSCAICQEAREAKLRQLRKLDFCSGQPLVDLEVLHERAVGRLATTVSDVMIPQNGSIRTHFAALSQTSKVLLGCWAVFFFFLTGK